MGVYLNPGNKNFEICAKARIYVDKTGLIGVVNRHMISLKKSRKTNRVSHNGQT